MPTKRVECILKKIFFFPSRNITLAVPVVLLLGFITGLRVDTSGLKKYIFPAIMLMIYPSMIGFRLSDIFSLSQGRLVLTAIAINFLIIPLWAYFLGVGFLLRDSQLFAGLIITSLLPSSNMTISFTVLAKGNVHGAIKLTAIELLLGSLLAPWYLWVLVGKYMPIDLRFISKSIPVIGSSGR